MQIKCVVLNFIVHLIIAKCQAQNLMILRYDSSTIKNECLLTICLDEFNSGITKSVINCKLDSISIKNSRIIPIKSKGISETLLFFNFITNTSLDTLEYTFCWNQKYNKLYKIKGFYYNDFYDFFEYLKETGVKLSVGYFTKQKVFIEGVDMLCLLELYNMKSKTKSEFILSDDYRRKFKCLHYYYEPVIVY